MSAHNGSGSCQDMVPVRETLADRSSQGRVSHDHHWIGPQECLSPTANRVISAYSEQREVQDLTNCFENCLPLLPGGGRPFSPKPPKASGRLGSRKQLEEFKWNLFKNISNLSWSRCLPWLSVRRLYRGESRNAQQ